MLLHGIFPALHALFTHLQDLSIDLQALRELRLHHAVDLDEEQRRLYGNGTMMPQLAIFEYKGK